MGRARARFLAARFGTELRIARVTAGLTQSALARLAQVSQQEVSKAERGATDVSLDVRCRLAAVTGHELGWRLYPVATVRLRDSGQLSVAQAIVDAAHPSWKAELEVPVARGDARAADLVLRGPLATLHVEIERALVDFQGQLRSAQLKRQALAVAGDVRPIRLVIAVPATDATRARLRPFRELIAEALPVTSREMWRALRDGTPPDGDGILLVRASRHRPADPSLPRGNPLP